MRFFMTWTAILVSAGCTGTAATVAWPDPAPFGLVPTSVEGPIASPRGDAVAPSPLAPRGTFKFKCEDEAMRFVNTPLPAMNLNAESPRSGETPARPLPGSLMDPWRRLDSEGTVSAPLNWHREVPGVTDNGFRTLSGRDLR
jgi:hypothetical protein